MVQVSYYAHKILFIDLYNIQYAEYWLLSSKRLEDRAANNRLAKEKVYLIFLIQKAFKALEKKLPS
jgi:hypothetical protein